MLNKKTFLLFAWSCFLCGCSRSPSIDVLGSYFPAWLLCSLIGIAFAVVMHFVLVRVKLDSAIPIKTLVYPCLAALCTFLVWILFFS